MGFNIACIVIDKNYNKSIDELAESMHWKIEVLEEIDFQQACANWTPDGELNIYFSDRATMVFYPFAWSIEPDHPQGCNSLAFAYSETSMMFVVSYLDALGNYRFFIEDDNRERTLESGNPLPIESDYVTADALIFKLFDILLDENFHDIDFNAKAYRCIKVSNIDNQSNSNEESYNDLNFDLIDQFNNKDRYFQIQYTAKEPKNEELTKVNNSIKRWWEFWK